MATTTVLVTGGCGFIGSHMVYGLLAETESKVVVLDNLYNGSEKALDRIVSLVASEKEVAEGTVSERLEFVNADLQDEGAVRAVFESRSIDSVVHFAAYKAVGESMAQPLRYFRNNVGGTLNLLQAMTDFGCTKLVFSSSCTVYGDGTPPLSEDSPLGPTNPYGRTKYMMEQMINDICIADGTLDEPQWSVVILRYFNPAGAHPSGLMGEDPRGAPCNLVPIVTQVASGQREHLTVFGTDYDTSDGTAERDYIHIMDLIDGHMAALQKLPAITGQKTYNLGSGRGTTVLEVATAMAEASGKPVPVVNGDRRPGDVPSAYCDPALANEELGWQTTRTIDDICRDSWLWWEKHPQGYDTPPQ